MRIKNSLTCLIAAYAFLVLFSSTATGKSVQDASKVPPIPKNSRRESSPPPPVGRGPVDANRYGYSMGARELAWRDKVGGILKSTVLSKNQNLSNLTCYFFVAADGSVLRPVTFSRTLSPAKIQCIENAILKASPLPSLPGDTKRKVYFEVTRNADTYVNFVE